MGFRDQDTGSTLLAKGTIAERPATPVDGMIRFNTDYEVYETYAQGEWQLLSETTRVLDGSSSQQAAPSAQYLIDNNLQTTSGTYWIAGGTQGDYTGAVNSNALAAKQVYCDLQGTDVGAGYMRVDSTWASYYSGAACNSGYGTLDANGLVKVSCNSGGGGPGSHGGCGVSVYTPIFARYAYLADRSFTSNGNWGGPQFPAPKWFINNSDDGIYNSISSGGTYPGWDPSGGGSNEYSQSTPPAGERDLGEYNNRIMHFGVGGYLGGFNRPCEARFWFK